MSKNVQELAEELGIDKNELAAMINGMSLGLMGVTGSTILTPMDVERIKKKHEADKAAPKNEPQEVEKAAAGPVRRRVKKDSGDEEVVAPVRRRRAKVTDGETTVVRRRAASATTETTPDAKASEKAPAKKSKIRTRTKVVAVTESPSIAKLGAKSDEDAKASESKVAVVEAKETEAPAVEAVAEKSAETVAEKSTSKVVEKVPAEKVSAEKTEAAPAPVAQKTEQVATQAATSDKKEDEAAAAQDPFAAKIVHRPSGRASQSRPKDPIEVEPFQQQPRRRGTPRATAEAAPETSTKRSEKTSNLRDTTSRAAVKAKVKAVPTPIKDEQPQGATVVQESGDEGKQGRSGATIVNQIDRSVVLDRLSAEGKDFTPGPKRSGSGRDRQESGRRGRKRVVEGSDLYEGSGRRRGRKGKKDKRKPQKTKITEAAEHKRVIRVEDAITVGDLAHQMGVKAGQVAMKLLELGMMATINTAIDFETAAVVAEEFNHTVENVAFDINEFFDTEPDPEDTLEVRPPVVTVMGHVDHGKTSLLDAIRSTTVASGEAGGITQHIGAYQVKTDNGVITFLDTPGHEAFTALRARGAQATDITVLVVAADDGVMPQTVEAINHSQAAGVPIVVAVNKIDKAGANVERVKQALTEYHLVPEEWGGSTLFVEVSAKEQRNIEDLISSIMLQAELEELRANYNRDAQGLVIDAQLDVGRGAVATLIVQRGTLKQGDIIVTGQYYGRVRMMTDDRGNTIKEAKPSQPVEITGLGGVPEAGEPFFVVKDDKDAKRITQNVIDQRRKEKLAARARETSISLEDLSAMIKEGEINELKVILKADVQGSIEALKQAFAKLGNDEVAVAVIHSAVGGVTENDVNLAASSEKGAVIVGFNVRPDNRAQAMAEKFGIKILTHTIIYDAIEQIRVLLEGMLEPIIEEETIGTAEVRDIFHSPKIGTVAGCYITKGLVKRGAKARVVRDSRVVYDSSIASLRRFKDNVNEVKYGYECGLSIENYSDIRIGDIIECYILNKVAAKL